ncbi:MAG: CBS domain-containing protein [Candidatus Krumholzibacteriota bacterium]|nr:CBS domain-containing protein [Candidatus Krumholzibacteriota bacterium]
MKIKSYMHRDFQAVSLDTPMKEIARLFFETGESVLPVIHADGSLAGVITIDDFILIFLPDYIDLIRNVDFIHDFGALEKTSFSVEETLFVAEDLMSENFTALDEDDSILKAAAALHRQGLARIPVVSGNQLVGMVSQNDICRAIYDMEGRD